MYHVFNYYFPTKHVREYKNFGYFNTFDKAFETAFENVKYYNAPYTRDDCLKEIKRKSFIDFEDHEYVQIHVREIKTKD